MRILIEPGDYEMTNLGDVAMTQVAVRRLGRLWPHARLEIVTRRPDRLRTFCPGAVPVPAAGQMRWCREGTIFGGSVHRRLLGPRLAAYSGQVEARIRQRRPRLVYRGLRLWQVFRPAQTWEATAFFEALSHADLFVVSGAGHLNSTFETHALDILNVLRLAHTLDVRTALFGQGLGPIQSPRLWEVARNVLPLADLIGLREKRKGGRLLENLGVDRARVIVTGDEAIELAYASRSGTYGRGIGVNVRCAFYSAVERRHLPPVRKVVQEAAARYAAPLIPLPVRLEGADSDIQTIRTLLEGYQGPLSAWDCTETPRQLAALIARCRMVVTGSYHGAVLAMAQGIPAVGLAASEYYVDKFLGLADMFEAGCEVLRLDDPEFAPRLEGAIARAWEQAESVRPLLLDAAVRQIAAAVEAYDRCGELVQPRAASRAGA